MPLCYTGRKKGIKFLYYYPAFGVKLFTFRKRLHEPFIY